MTGARRNHDAVINRRPLMAIVAATLIGLGATVGDVVAGGHLPRFSVREVDRFWRAAPQTSSGTPNAQPGNAYGSGVYQETTLA